MGYLDEDDQFFSFRRMWTPTLIQIVYVLGIISMIIYFVVSIIDRGIVGLLTGVVMLAFGNLLWRVICEGIVVAFSIHRELTVVSDELRQIRREAAAIEEREHE